MKYHTTILISLGLCLLASSCMKDNTKVKDQALISIFEKYKTEFEDLRKMANEDANLIGYISISTLEKSKLSKDRQEEYMELITRITPSPQIGTGSAQVTFHFYPYSPVKGITYIPTITSIYTVMKNLDGKISNDGIYISPIEGNWYLIYTRLPD